MQACLRDILDKVKGLNSRLSDITADVEDLKKKDQAHQKMKKVGNRSRSRSPRSRSREWASQHSGEWCSQTMRKESYSSEEDNIEDLAEVSEETHRLHARGACQVRLGNVPEVVSSFLKWMQPGPRSWTQY